MLNDKLKNWKIIKDELSDSITFDEALLTEDIFQAKKDDYVIDFGWYEGIEKFITLLVIKNNWENPIIRIQSDSYEQGLLSINLCVDFIDNLK